MDSEHEQRGYERRLAVLEEKYVKMEQAIQRVELQQGYLREVLDSRFQALNKGQDVLVAKIDGMSLSMQQAMADPGQSPAGRNLQGEMEILRSKQGMQTVQIDNLQASSNRMQGALELTRFMGAGALLTAVLALVGLALRIFGLLG